MLKKNISDGVGSRNELIDTPLDPPPFWLDNIFNIQNFLTAQQATWILKTHLSLRDNWRAKLNALSYGNVLCLGPEIIAQFKNPLLYGIAVSYERIRISHDNLHCKFTRAIVINNKLFLGGRVMREF